MAMSNMLVFLESWIAYFCSMALAYTVFGVIVVAAIGSAFLIAEEYKRRKGKSNRALEVEDDNQEKKVGFWARRRARKELSKAQAQEAVRVEEVEKEADKEAKAQAKKEVEEARIDAAGEAVIEEVEAEIAQEDAAAAESTEVEAPAPEEVKEPETEAQIVEHLLQ